MYPNELQLQSCTILTASGTVDVKKKNKLYESLSLYVKSYGLD